MASKFKNIAGLFSDSRTRAIVIFTLLILGIAMVAGFLKLRSATPAAVSGTSVADAPNIESIPGGFDKKQSPAYARLQQQQNQQQAKQAEQTGKSAIPTIISASSVENQGFNDASVKQPASSGIICVSPGTTLYTSDCQVIGQLGPDGTVHMANGQIYGQKSVASNLTAGTLVYGPDGSVLGTVGADGYVRNAQGQIVGRVGADGLVRDSSGRVIGQTAPFGEGTPVYGPDGKMIGFVGPGGIVRDAQGRIIGQVGPDGVVRNSAGQVIGKAGYTRPNQLVYNSDGKVVGKLGADGIARDASGNALGTVGQDGKVYSSSGQVVGEAAPFGQGSPVYGPDGKLLGVVGADGFIRDAQGRIIGKAGATGEVYDAQNRLIGRVPTSSVSVLGKGASTPAYDSYGKLVGNIDEKGHLRDSSGGHVSPRGQVTPGAPGTTLAANGNLVPATQTNPNSPEAVRARQEAMLKSVEAQQARQNIQSVMMGQGGQLMGAWTVAASQSYVEGTPPEKETKTLQAQQALAASQQPQGTIIKAGTIMFAVLTTGINSDQPGPILANVVGGSLKGGKLIGRLSNQGQAVMITFDRMTIDQYPKSFGVNIVAIDPETARTGLSSYTDNHYLLRYGSLFASSFLQGYAQAISQSGSTVVSNGFNTVTNMPDLSPQGQLVVALGAVGQAYGAQVAKFVNTPPTVYVYEGTAVGLLFTDDTILPFELGRG